MREWDERVDPFRPDFDRIEGTDLYVGSRPERGFDQQREWVEARIRTIVCLEPRVRYTVSPGVVLIHTPMFDVEGPEGIPAALDRVLRLTEVEGGPALIHCTAGLNRSGFVAVALLARGGMEVTSAIARVRQARPGALFNRHFERVLLERRW